MSFCVGVLVEYCDVLRCAVLVCLHVVLVLLCLVCVLYCAAVC